jgi:hypothetical protein
MGFLSNNKKSKNNSDIVPLYEREHSQYRVKQVYKVGRMSKSQKEVRILMLTEEGVKIMDVVTNVCLLPSPCFLLFSLFCKSLTLP